MKGYKAFESDWTCRGFQYKIGEIYELAEGEELKICKCGFHFCKNPIDVFGYYDNVKNIRIAEVEGLGKIEQEGTKYVTDKIKIVKELNPKELQKLIVDNHYNTGVHNTGQNNSGGCNTGNFNSGYCNTGDYNSGNSNTGNYNNGNFNTGWFNDGSNNSGFSNSGYCNTGSYNSGSHNSGNYNKGYSNTGWFNSGNLNTGLCNSGNRNSGIFNSDEPFMRAFNKPTTVRATDFFSSLDYNFKELVGRIFDNDLSSKDIERIEALPNFDTNIFKEITGIDIESEKEKSVSNNSVV